MRQYSKEISSTLCCYWKNRTPFKKKIFFVLASVVFVWSFIQIYSTGYYIEQPLDKSNTFKNGNFLVEKLNDIETVASRGGTYQIKFKIRVKNEGTESEKFDFGQIIVKFKSKEYSNYIDDNSGRYPISSNYGIPLNALENGEIEVFGASFQNEIAGDVYWIPGNDYRSWKFIKTKYKIGRIERTNASPQ